MMAVALYGTWLDSSIDFGSVRSFVYGRCNAPLAHFDVMLTPEYIRTH